MHRGSDGGLDQSFGFTSGWWLVEQRTRDSDSLSGTVGNSSGSDVLLTDASRSISVDSLRQFSSGGAFAEGGGRCQELVDLLREIYKLCALNRITIVASEWISTINN